MQKKIKRKLNHLNNNMKKKKKNKNKKKQKKLYLKIT